VDDAEEGDKTESNNTPGSIPETTGKGFDEEKDLNKWSKDEVKAWLEHFQEEGGEDFKIDRVACLGKRFAARTKADLKEFADGLVGIHIFNAKEALLSKQKAPSSPERQPAKRPFEIHRPTETKVELGELTLEGGNNQEIGCVEEMKEGDFFYVDGIIHAGLKEKQLSKEADDRMLLYLRAEGYQHLRRLEEVEGGNALLVDGPKGSGKSVISWTWARLKAKQGKSVLWIHVDNFATSHVTILKLFKDDIRRVYFGDKPIKFQQLVKSDYVLDAPEDIIILDGFHWKDHEEILIQLWDTIDNLAPTRISIVVSSMTATFSVQELKMARAKKYRIASWTFKEYKEVIKNRAFYRQVESKLGGHGDKNAKLLHKFYYSGISARFTFHFTVEEVKEEIKRGTMSVGNLSDIAEGNVTSANENAVNALYGGVRLPSGEVRDVFVSQYAHRLIFLNAPSQMKRAYRFAKQLDNPSFLGWVVEADFLGIIEKLAEESGKLDLLNSEGNTKFQLKIKSHQKFDKIEDVEWKDGAVCVPNRWNYPTFDFLYCYTVQSHKMKDKKVVMFGNVTVQNTPKSCKLQHVAIDSKKLGVNRVRFVGVKPYSEKGENKDIAWKDPPKPDPELGSPTSLDGFYHGPTSYKWNKGNNFCETLFFKSDHHDGRRS